MDARKESGGLRSGLEAAAAAAGHADRLSAGALWTRIAWVRFMEFLVDLRHRGESQFTTEDFREWANGDLSQPPDLRAFGHLTRKASMRKLIRKTPDTVPTINPYAHGREVRVWELT